MKNQLRSGVYLSYINLAIGSILPFIYTPIMLELLGQAEYGLYSLSNSVVGYLSLLSFGFGSTIVRYLAKYRADNNRDALEKTYGFFLLLYGALAVLVLIGGIIISGNVSFVFDKGLNAAEIEKMRTLVIIISINTAISFPMSVFSSVAIAYERYFFRKILDIISTVAGPIVNLIALYMGYASVGMALAGVVLTLLFAPANIIYCFRSIKIKPRFEKLPKDVVMEMLGFSLFAFIGTIVDMLFWATDKVILGMLTSSVAVAVYNVGVTFNSVVMSLSTSISGVLVPKITKMVTVETDKKEWTNLFIRIGRIQFIIIALIVAGFTVFGQTFIDLWAGPEYADAYWIAILTMFPLCIPLIQNTGLTFVVAQNKHQFRAVLYLIIALINVISTYIIVPYMGIIGAALCTCIAYFIGPVLIMNVYYYKVTGLNVPLFWKNILEMSIVPVIMLFAGIILLRLIVINSWIVFFTIVFVYSAIYIVLMYLFSFNESERDVIRVPLRKVYSCLCSRSK